MTNKPEILPSPNSLAWPPSVVFLAFPDMGLLDITGPQTVFWAATKAREARGLPGYVRHVASIEGGLIPSAEGVSLQTTRLADLSHNVLDTVVVPGSPDMPQLIDTLVAPAAWLRQASLRARRTVSVCSGAFLLAQAGLLHGKKAATHWGMCDVLKARFPSVEVDHDAIFVQQGPVWTSAGVTAGIDLALALVEDDCGRDIAMEVARELVVFLKRPGGQSQFSELLRAQTSHSMGFDDLHLWITANLASDALSVESLAARANMSPRNFARVYKQKTGRTPAKAVEVFRLEAARRLLEESEHNIDQVARLCGFGDEERMRVTFQRNLSIAPRDYRRRFSR